MVWNNQVALHEPPLTTLFSIHTDYVVPILAPEGFRGINELGAAVEFEISNIEWNFLIPIPAGTERLVASACIQWRPSFRPREQIMKSMQGWSQTAQVHIIKIYSALTSDLSTQTVVSLYTLADLSSS